MAVRFILGRSGTGKTRHCIDSIIEALLQKDETPLVLLVPEQASYQAERAVVADGRIRGYSRLSVLSFNRLGFMLLGRRMALGALSRNGQEMAVQAILGRHKDALRMLGPSSALVGTGTEVARSLTELQQADMEPDDVAQLADYLSKRPGEELAARKFHDLAIIYARYREFLANRFSNPDMELSLARKAVPQAGFLRNARIWIDGFAGFTRQEFELLVELLKVASQSEIALCLDPTKLDLAACKRECLDPTGLFYPTECTYADLLEAIGKCRLKMERPHLLEGPRRFSSPALAAIEGCISGHMKAGSVAAGGMVRLLAGANARTEAQFAAHEISRLTRSCGYRYRDIAVVAPDVGTYRHYIEVAMRDCGIPFFVDTPKPLSMHPLAQLVLAAVRAATEGFHTSDVMAFLKSGLGPLPEEEVSTLENYCVACGVDAADWTSSKPWNFAAKAQGQFDEAAVDAARRKAVQPLANLRGSLLNSSGLVTAVQFTEGVFGLVEELKVRTVLGGWNDAGDEHRRFYDRFVGLYDEFVEVFGDTRMGPQEYAAIMRSAIDGASLAVIPPKLDQVLVGTIERSRHPDMRAVILIGCTQGQFPSPLRRGSVLTDEDRQAAETAGRPLGETIATQLAARQYLSYIALTRASERLYITWPLAGQDGSAGSPTEVVETLRSLFGDLAVELIKPEAADLADVQGEFHMADLLCARLGRDADNCTGTADGSLATLLTELRKTGEFTRLTGTVDASLGYENVASLDAPAAAAAFDGEIRSSVTRLSSFAACPYQHFAGYVLELKPREQFRLEPMDMGSFYHAALDGLTRSLLQSGQQFSTAGQDEIVRLLHGAVERVFASDGFLAAFRSRSPHNAFIVEQAVAVLDGCVQAIARGARAGKLRTVASELVFDTSHRGLGPIVIPLRGGRKVLLRGKIDRLDVAEADGFTNAFVFDYKTSAKGVSWTDLYYGLDLQLPLYLLAVDGQTVGNQGKLRSAGAFYFPIRTAIETVTLADMANDGEQPGAAKAAGIFDGQTHRLLDGQAARWSTFYNFYVGTDGEPYGFYGISGAARPQDYTRLLDFVSGKMRTLAERVVSGEIDVRPYRIGGQSPCGSCDYRPVCRFDWQVNEYNFLKRMGKTGVLAESGGGNG
jgi:ATP-dependent helicase/nuclease subunit B